jgi:hypothetical protein
MPKVTIDPETYVRVDLKNAPGGEGEEDGYVMLRPLPYGMKLTRRDKATRMKMMAEMPKGGRGVVENQHIELETYSEWATAFDFAYCIGEHNLQTADGSLIDFTNAMSLKMLDPKVGSEIELAINRLNEDEDEELLEDFLQRSTTSSENGDSRLATDLPERPETEKFV